MLGGAWRFVTYLLWLLYRAIKAFFRKKSNKSVNSFTPQTPSKALVTNKKTDSEIYKKYEPLSPIKEAEAPLQYFVHIQQHSDFLNIAQPTQSLETTLLPTEKLDMALYKSVGASIVFEKKKDEPITENITWLPDFEDLLLRLFQCFHYREAELEEELPIIQNVEPTVIITESIGKEILESKINEPILRMIDTCVIDAMPQSRD